METLKNRCVPSHIHQDLQCVFENDILITNCLPKQCDIDKQDERGRTAIFVAHENYKYDEHICNLLLKLHPNVNIPSFDGSYPVHIASKKCRVTAVDNLIKFGADIDVKDMFKRSPLHYAVAYNDEDVIQLLIEKGCKISEIDAEGNGLHHLAAMRKDLKASEILRFLLELELNFDLPNAYGKTVLHYAVMNIESLKVVLPNMKNSIDLTDKDGKTALHYACTYTRFHDRVKLLLDSGADPKVVDKYGRHCLMYACKYGKLQTMNTLLPYFMGDINAQDKLGNTALHYACMKTNIALQAKQLVSAGANTDIQNAEGKTPLMLALEMHSTDTVDFLLRQTSKPNIQDNQGRTALHYILVHDIGYNVVDEERTGTYLTGTTLSGTKSYTTDLLKRGADLHLLDMKYMTPLHYACSCRQGLDIVKLLVSRETDLYARDNDGRLPIHIAVENKALDIVQYLFTVSHVKRYVPSGIFTSSADMASYVHLIEFLIRHDISLDQFQPLADGILVAAAKYSNLESFNLLWEEVEKCRPENIDYLLIIRELCIRNDFEFIRWVLQKSKTIDINATNDKCSSLLHYAARYSDLEIIKELVESGANIFAENQKKAQPIHIACKYSQRQTIVWLMETMEQKSQVSKDGTKIQDYIFNLKDEQEKGVLHYAAQNKNMDVVMLFLERNFDIRCCDKKNQTVLHYGTKHFTIGIVREFYRRGADINSRNVNGSTPLHLAAREGNISFLKGLIENGGNIDLLDNNGQTAATIAASNRQFNAAKLLLRYNRNKSPLHLACENTNFDAVYNLLRSNNGSKTIDDSDIDGKSALHYASESGNHQIAYILSIFGADLEIKDRFGKTPLHVAVESSDIPTVTLLLHHGASVDVKDKDLRTPLHYSVMANMQEMTGVLIAHGASADVKDGQGKKPIEYTSDKDLMLILQPNAYNEANNFHENGCEANEMVYENICILEMEIIHLKQEEYILRPTIKGYTAIDHIKTLIQKDPSLRIHFLVKLKDNHDEEDCTGALLKYAVLFLIANLPYGYLKDHIGSYCHDLKTVVRIVTEKRKLSTFSLDDVLVHEIYSANEGNLSFKSTLDTTIDKDNFRLKNDIEVIYPPVISTRTPKALLHFVQYELQSLPSKRCKLTFEAMKSDIQKGVVRGRLNDVAKLIAKGRDLNVKDDNGWSVLHYCILHDMEEFAMMFLRHGVDINHKTRDVSPISGMTCSNSHPLNKRICNALSPLLLSTILARRKIVKYIAENTTITSLDFQMCLKLTLGTPVEEVLMQGLCEQLKRNYPTLSLEAFPAYLKSSPLQRVISGLSKKVFKTFDTHILSVKVTIRNPDFFDDEDSTSDDENPLLTDDKAQHVKAVISENAGRLWKCHSLLNVISGAGQKPTNRADFLDAMVVLYTECKNIIPLCERPYPTFLRNENMKIDIAVREGKALLGPLGSPSRFPIPPIRTLRMGSCIGMEGGNSGTMGPIVDLGNDKLGFLTCAHVFFKNQIQDSSESHFVFDERSSNLDTPSVVQPTDEEIQQSEENDQNDNANQAASSSDVGDRKCGLVTKAKFGTWNNTSIDAALVSITKPSRQPYNGTFTALPRSRLWNIGFTTPPVFNSGAIQESIAGKYGAEVIQFGSSTSCTSGRVVFDGLQARLKKVHQISFVCCEEYRNTLQCQHMKTKYDLTGLYEVKSSNQYPFFDLGDSGSGVFVVNRQNNNELTCIGVSIALNTERNTIVTPIKPILDALGGLKLKDFTNAHRGSRKRSSREAFGTSCETRE